MNREIECFFLNIYMYIYKKESEEENTNMSGNDWCDLGLIALPEQR